MATYQATIPSAWPADETFNYLATFSNAALWDPGVLSGEALDAGRVATGSRFRLVVPFLGRDLALTYVVTHYSAENWDVLLEARSGPLEARDRIIVTAAAPHDATPGSLVGYRAEVTLRGPLRLLEPVLKRGFLAVGDRAAQGLAKVLAVPRNTAARAS